MTNSKFTEEQVADIRQRAAGGESYSKLGQAFGASKTTISKLVRGASEPVKSLEDLGEAAPEQATEPVGEPVTDTEAAALVEAGAEVVPAEKPVEEVTGAEAEAPAAPTASEEAKKEAKERTPHSVGAALRRFQRHYYVAGEPSTKSGRNEVLDKTIKGMEEEEVKAFQLFLARSAGYLKALYEPTAEDAATK